MKQVLRIYVCISASSRRLRWSGADRGNAGGARAFPLRAEHPREFLCGGRGSTSTRLAGSSSRTSGRLAAPAMRRRALDSRCGQWRHKVMRCEATATSPRSSGRSRSSAPAVRAARRRPALFVQLRQRRAGKGRADLFQHAHDTQHPLLVRRERDRAVSMLLEQVLEAALPPPPSSSPPAPSAGTAPSRRRAFWSCSGASRAR